MKWAGEQQQALTMKDSLLWTVTQCFSFCHPFQIQENLNRILGSLMVGKKKEYGNDGHLSKH